MSPGVGDHYADMGGDLDYVGQFDPLELASALVSPVRDATVSGSLRVEWEYSSALHAPETVRAISEVLLDELRSIAPQRRREARS